MIKSKIKRLLRVLSGQVNHIKKTANLHKKWYGNQYGGFYVYPKFLNQNSIIYSFGIGEDISFDISVIENHNCHVFGFDPTPKSIKWVKQHQSLPSKFIFFEYGIADKSGMIDFYLPKNIEHVSGSFIKQDNVDDKQKVLVEMKSWEDIVNTLGHSQIDVLKMDIEGAEYNILDSFLESSVPIIQILIEFHDRLFDDGKIKSINAIKKLKNHGYEIFGISDSFEEVSFIKKTILK
jgi:FkbM family methyltransferase